MQRRCHRLLPWLLAGLLGLPATAWGQQSNEGKSLAEIARESKRKKEQWTGKIWTNDDLGTVFPEIRVLGKNENVLNLGAFDGTPLPIVEAMLRLADVQPGEVVFDLGSGDGRIVILAAEEFGARGVGIEIDDELAAQSRRTVAEKGLEDQVKIIHANAFDVDLSLADVVTLYVAPTVMDRLREHLERALRPGTRVVSHQHEVTGWEPERVLDLDGFFLYLYRIQ
ncbi:MAG: class I SAM-dependent methyltransferase [Candidatus Acidoferrales bacterium]